MMAILSPETAKLVGTLRSIVIGRTCYLYYRLNMHDSHNDGHEAEEVCRGGARGVLEGVIA